MYSVLIVEDEMFVRHSIRAMLDWRSAGVDQVLEAANGLEALELYRRYHPDVILTDLKMPVMDGMELIRTVRKKERDSRTRFVIMSCLDEFPLVQEALNLGVSHYFLKVTASPEDIQAVLTKILRELGAPPSDARASAARPEELLQSLAEGRALNGEASARLFETLSLNPADTHAMLLICLNRREECPDAVLPDAAALSAALEETLQPAPQLMRLSPGRYACLLTDRQAADFHARAEGTASRLTGEGSVSLQLGLSPSLTGASRLGEMYACAMRALYACFFANAPYVRCESDAPFSLPESVSMRLLSLPGTFTHLPGKFIDTYEAKMCQFTARSYDSPDDFRRGLCAMVVWLSAQTDCICDSMEEMSVECNRRITASPSLPDAVAAFEQFATEILSLSSFSQRMPASITQALLYIHTNLDHALTLNEIAEHTHLNPSYLSTLFHKVMRQSLISYINSVRIERARLLLRNTDLPISRIASSLGFSQDIYFYRLFKRIARETPSEYRARFRSIRPNAPEA